MDGDDDNSTPYNNTSNHNYGNDGGSTGTLGKVGVEIFEDEISEERRLKLRQIENKVLAFQDELESGRKKIKHDESIQSLVEQYREKLLKKVRSF